MTIKTFYFRLLKHPLGRYMERFRGENFSLLHKKPKTEIFSRVNEAMIEVNIINRIPSYISERLDTVVKN